MGECLLVAGICQVVSEACIQLRPVCERPGGNFLGDRAEGLEVATRIPVPPWMVGDDGDAAVEEGGECGHFFLRNEAQSMDACQVLHFFRTRPTVLGEVRRNSVLHCPGACGVVWVC